MNMGKGEQLPPHRSRSELGRVGDRAEAQAGAWPGPWDGVGPRGQQGACREHPESRAGLQAGRPGRPVGGLFLLSPSFFLSTNR